MKRGQSILEYVITLTVVIAAMMLAMGRLGSRVNTGMNSSADAIGNLLQSNPTIRGAAQ